VLSARDIALERSFVSCPAGISFTTSFQLWYVMSLLNSIHGDRSWTKENPLCWMACVIICDTMSRSLEKTRATKVAPYASARVVGFNGRAMFPYGDEGKRDVG